MQIALAGQIRHSASPKVLTQCTCFFVYKAEKQRKGKATAQIAKQRKQRATTITRLAQQHHHEKSVDAVYHCRLKLQVGHAFKSNILYELKYEHTDLQGTQTITTNPALVGNEPLQPHPSSCILVTLQLQLSWETYTPMIDLRVSSEAEVTGLAQSLPQNCQHCHVPLTKRGWAEETDASPALVAVFCCTAITSARWSVQG
jgi:hypothetical protein